MIITNFNAPTIVLVNSKRSYSVASGLKIRFLLLVQNIVEFLVH